MKYETDGVERKTNHNYKQRAVWNLRRETASYLNCVGESNKNPHVFQLVFTDLSNVNVSARVQTITTLLRNRTTELKLQFKFDNMPMFKWSS